jgi:polysaccharide pyruvyl transferase WcaK-like protein
MGLSASPRKICVISHGGTKNLGDEALFATVVQNTRLRIPDAEIIGFTISPEDTRKRHGIPCFPVRRSENPVKSQTDSAMENPAPLSATSSPATGGSEKIKSALKSIPGLRPLISIVRGFASGLVSVLAEPKFLIQSYRRLKGAQLLLAAGGQQLNDGYGGPWGYPFTLYKWTLLAKLTGTKVALLSVGAGPIDSPLSKFFFRRTLNLVDYRSYRDAISSKLMASLGIKGVHPVFPDLVYSLRLPEPKPSPAGSQRVVVGTNPVPFFGAHYWPNPDEARYQEYVHKFAKFAEWLDKSGRSVLFFPTQVRADAITINDIRAAMNGPGNSPNLLERQPIHNLEDLVSEISRADLIVANRYHAILISLMMNKPVLGIAYHEKSRALLEQAGQGDYVLKIEDFKIEELMERLEALETNAPALKKRIGERMAPLRKALEQQYDAVFGLIGVNPDQPTGRPLSDS